MVKKTKSSKEKSSIFFKTLINSRGYIVEPGKKKRRLKKKEFCKKLFPHFFEYCENIYSWDYIYKLTARLQDSTRNIPPLFSEYYTNHNKELKEDLKNNATSNLDCPLFYKNFSLSEEDEIADYLFNEICKFFEL